MKIFEKFVTEKTLNCTANFAVGKIKNQKAFKHGIYFKVNFIFHRIQCSQKKCSKLMIQPDKYKKKQNK